MRSRNLVVPSTIAALPVGIALWTGGLLLSELRLGGFGLIGGLHAFWYAGLVVIVLGMLAGIATRRHSSLLTTYALAIVVVVVASGMLLEREPRFPYIYQSYTYGHEILQTGVIDYTKAYASWPGWHVFTAVVVGATGISPSVMLTWAPLWMALVTLAALMTLFRRFRLPRHQYWLAVALAAVAFISPVYPTPGSAAFILVVFLVAIVLDEYVRTSAIGNRAGILVLFAALVITHLLTSVVGLAAVVGTSIVATAVRRRVPGSAAIFGAVLIAAYLFYVAVNVTAELLPRQVELILDLDQLFSDILGRTSAGVVGGSPDHTRVVFVRIAYVVGLAALATAGGAVAVAHRTRWRRLLLPSVWVAAGLASLGLGAYGGEILARASALAAPGSLVLASWLARALVGRVILGSAIVLAAVASPINHFGNELFDSVRPAELAADRVLNARHPTPWNLVRRSRTWYQAAGESQTGPYVTVYGPLFLTTSAFLTDPDPPVMPFWSYDNGAVRIMISNERFR